MYAVARAQVWVWIFFWNLHRSLEFLSPKEEMKQNREMDRMEKARGEEK